MSARKALLLAALCQERTLLAPRVLINSGQVSEDLYEALSYLLISVAFIKFVRSDSSFTA